MMASALFPNCGPAPAFAESARLLSKAEGCSGLTSGKGLEILSTG